MSTEPAGFLDAYRDERQAVIDFYGCLDAEDWTAPSRAEGWSVHDVLLHLTGGVRGLLTADAVRMMTTRDFEELNEHMVAAHRSQPPAETLAEFARWSGRAARTVLRLAVVPVAGALPVRIGNLGRYPLRLNVAAFVFDWHTHLRYDIAPALNREIPETDDRRMSTVIAWMLAMAVQQPVTRALVAPISVTLTGQGGGAWRFEPGARRTRVTPGDSTGTLAQIVAQSREFPEWGTGRKSWRECDVTIAGDTAVATEFLSGLHIA